MKIRAILAERILTCKQNLFTAGRVRPHSTWTFQMIDDCKSSVFPASMLTEAKSLFPQHHKRPKRTRLRSFDVGFWSTLCGIFLRLRRRIAEFFLSVCKFVKVFVIICREYLYPKCSVFSPLLSKRDFCKLDLTKIQTYCKLCLWKRWFKTLEKS